MSRGELALAFISGGLGFAIADFVDRYVATYNPSATTAAPTNKFTIPAGSTTQAGTLANTLNIATSPGLLRIGVGIGITAVPAIGAYLVKNSMGRAALQGMMLGAGIKLFSTLWNAYVMGNLLKPAASDAKTLQASLGARLYPAEVTAAQNMATSPVPYTAPNPGLSAAPAARPGGGAQQRPQQHRPQQRPQTQRPQGMGDPGPFAVAQAPAVCPPGQVADSLTGQCVAPGPDGSTPAGGQYPPSGNQPVAPPSNFPAPAPTPNPAPAPPGAPNGGWTRVNVPQGECGLGDQMGVLPDFLGFLSQ